MRTLLVLTLLTLVAALVPGANEALTYDRTAFAHGELWRLVTGHLTHDSTRHLGYDLLAVWTLGIACERLAVGSARRALLLGAAAISCGLLPLSGDVEIYRGLSALATALYACALGTLFARGRRANSKIQVALAASLLAGFLFKTGFEIVQGAPLFAPDPGIIPWPLAHLVGAAAGLAAAFPIRTAPLPETASS